MSTPCPLVRLRIVYIIYASDSKISTAFLSVFCIMGTGQCDMLRNGREQFPEHMDLENSVAVHHILNLVGILVELEADVLHPVIFIGKLYPFLHPIDEACTQGILIGGA